jgi:hypothetical protein
VIHFDPQAAQSAIDFVGPQNAERLAVGALTVGGMGAGWLAVKAGWASARLGLRGARAAWALAARLLTPKHSDLTLALLGALDDPDGVVVGASLKTIRLVCDFAKGDLLVGPDEVRHLLTKREERAVWKKARLVRNAIEAREAEEMRQLIVSEIRGDDAV